MSMTARLIETRHAALAAPLACGCCLAIGAAYVAADDPSDGGFLPCPFRAATGMWCVGCGLTRATHQLLRGNLVTAIHLNLFVIPVLSAIVIGWFTWLMRSAGRPTPWRRPVPAWAYATMITAALAFAVVRNLPGVPGLRG